MSDTDNRTEVVLGLRALADFIEQHPEFPAPFWVDARTHLQGSYDENCAEVDRIAGILDVSPRTTTANHYRVSRMFGGSVEYKAVAIPPDVMDRWDAASSYHGSVTP